MQNMLAPVAEINASVEALVVGSKIAVYVWLGAGPVSPEKANSPSEAHVRIFPFGRLAAEAATIGMGSFPGDRGCIRIRFYSGFGKVAIKAAKEAPRVASDVEHFQTGAKAVFHEGVNDCPFDTLARRCFPGVRQRVIVQACGDRLPVREVPKLQATP